MGSQLGQHYQGVSDPTGSAGERILLASTRWRWGVTSGIPR